MIVIFVTLFILCEFLSKKPAMLLFVVLFGICFVLLSGAMDSIISFMSMILSRGTGTGLNLTGRENFWRVAIDMFLKNPIFGAGVNTYDYYFNFKDGTSYLLVAPMLLDQDRQIIILMHRGYEIHSILLRELTMCICKY